MFWVKSLPMAGIFFFFFNFRQDNVGLTLLIGTVYHAVDAFVVFPCGLRELGVVFIRV